MQISIVSSAIVAVGARTKTQFFFNLFTYFAALGGKVQHFISCACDDFCQKRATRHQAFKQQIEKLLQSGYGRNRSHVLEIEILKHRHTETAALWPRGVMLLVPSRPEVM